MMKTKRMKLSVVLGICAQLSFAAMTQAGTYEVFGLAKHFRA